MVEILLNRWRGTGKIYKYLTGTMIYSIYLGLLFGLVTQSIYIGLFTVVSFLLAESMGFGKWVGALCYPENKTDLQKEYDDLEGYNFPYIHKIANSIVKERKDFLKYCNVALFIRGLIWGLCLYLPLVFGETIINIILNLLNSYWLFIYGNILFLKVSVQQSSIFDYLVASILYGIGFPLACYLSRLKSFIYTSKWLILKDRWHTQELYYGAIHAICNIYIIIRII